MLRSAILLSIGLALGFACGWVAKRPATPTAQVAAPTTGKYGVPSTPSATPLAGPATPAPLSSPSPKLDRLHNRFAVVSELQQAGIGLSFFPIGLEGFDRRLAKFLDASPAELAQLDAAIAEASNQIVLARRAVAKSTRSPDGQKLIVDVPSLDPRASGPIFDRFVNQVEATLGAERYAAFRQVTRDSLERALDQFGLNTLRYEVSLRARPGEPGIIEWSRTSTDPVTGMRSTGNSLTPFVNIQKHDPLLADLLPPELRVAR